MLNKKRKKTVKKCYAEVAYVRMPHTLLRLFSLDRKNFVSFTKLWKEQVKRLTPSLVSPVTPSSTRDVASKSKIAFVRLSTNLPLGLNNLFPTNCLR